MANIALVLSGGGVKGLAHIGVIKFLEENNIEVSHISGTSSGALVGMMFASGLKSEEILHYFMKTSILTLKNYSFGKPGFLDITKYEQELIDLTGAEKFEDLQKKFYVTTTNLFTSEEKVFFQGSLIKPVLASAAFPLVFSPVEIGNDWYADGGIVNNFPVENVPLEVDYIIGVNLNFVSTIDSSALRNSLSVIERSFNVMMNSKNRQKKNVCNVFISPSDISEIGVFEMKKRLMAFEIGYQAALEKKDELLSLKNK